VKSVSIFRGRRLADRQIAFEIRPASFIFFSDSHLPIGDILIGHIPFGEYSALTHSALRPLFVVLSASIFSITGCGGGGGFSDVTGTVTIKGQPAPEGTGVTFSPVAGSAPDLMTATGRLDAQGKFQLFSGNEGTIGAKPGKYKVFLSPKPNDGAYMQGGGSAPPKVDLGPIPKEFASPDTSPKEVEVTAGQPNVIDITI